jgi:hypothetical protein
LDSGDRGGFNGRGNGGKVAKQQAEKAVILL